MVLLVAALVGGFFMPAMASFTNGVAEPEPEAAPLSVQLLAAIPLAPGEVLVCFMVEREGQETLVTILSWPGGRELAVSPLGARR